MYGNLIERHVNVDGIKGESSLLNISGRNSVTAMKRRIQL